MSGVLVNHVEKRFGPNVVVPDLCLTVQSGEFLSLLGPSGCGKTTALRMIAGLENPTAGDITIGETRVYDQRTSLMIPPERRNLGMVFQSYAIWPHLTVFENVAFPLRCRKTAKSEIQSRTMECLKLVRLDALHARKPNQLSGGQQQRVALARALVSRPSVVLLDEPLSNLDANLRDEMCEEIRKIHQDFKLTMIYVTHDQSEAFRLSNRIAVMNLGRIEQIANPTDLKSSPATEFVRSFLRM